MRRHSRKRSFPDLTLFLIVLVLIIFGIVMVYDSSVVYASDLFGGKYYFLILQFFWVLTAIVIALMVSFFDYHFLERYTRILLFISLIFLLILALHRIIPQFLLGFYEIFVPKINGAYRWFYFNPRPLPSIPIIGRIGFQPSELAKIALSIYLASLLSSKKRNNRAWRPLLLVGIVGALIVAQPDFGTASIIVGVSLLIYYVSGVSWRRLALATFVISIVGLVFVFASPYRRQRLMTYVNPGQSDSLSNRYQINQIMIALGSGGLSGLGFGRSVQKYGYIPEVSTDSIFSVVGEEFGFVGTTAMIFLFFFLIQRSLWIVDRAPDEFGRLLGSGIIGFIGLQVFLNLFSVTHLVPLTGVPLPLISYGGSSLVVNLFALGIILNISRQIITSKR